MVQDVDEDLREALLMSLQDYDPNREDKRDMADVLLPPQKRPNPDSETNEEKRHKATPMAPSASSQEIYTTPLRFERLSDFTLTWTLQLRPAIAGDGHGCRRGGTADGEYFRCGLYKSGGARGTAIVATERR